MDLLQQTDELFFTRTNLDLDQQKNRKAALAGGDDGELFLEMRHAEMLAFDDGRLKTASYDQSSGFGLAQWLARRMAMRMLANFQKRLGTRCQQRLSSYEGLYRYSGTCSVPGRTSRFILIRTH